MAVKQFILDHKLPEEWHSLFPEAVLLKTQSINSFLESQGLSKKDRITLLNVLLRDPEFYKFYSRDEQYRLARFSKEVTDKTAIATTASLPRRIITNQAKYGSSSPFGSKEVRDKARATFESNGYLNPFEDKAIQDKALQKSFRNQQVQESLRKRFFDKHGVVSPMQVPEYKAAAIAAMDEEWRKKVRDGTRAAIVTPEATLAVERSNVAKFNLKYRTAFQTVQECRAYSLRNDGFQAIDVIPSSHDSSKFWAKHSVCGKDVLIHFTSSNIPCACPICSSQQTKFEIELKLFIRDLVGDSTIDRDRTVISPKEIDIFLPSFSVGFEINGAFSHNSSIQPYHFSDRILPHVEVSYHADKTSRALSGGIKLYHLWEHYPISLCKSFIRAKLGFCQKLYARNLRLDAVTQSESESFLKENHFQGSARSIFRVGLFDNEKLVQLLCFRNRSNGVMEIARNATLCNYVVTGGFTRLLHHSTQYIHQHYPHIHQIITYADRDLTPDPHDSVYTRHHFQYLGDSGSSMSYWALRTVRNPEGFTVIKHDSIISRRLLQKQFLYKYNGCTVDGSVFEVDYALTEQQNLFRLGIHPLYNSGCHKYTLLL